MHEIHGLSQAQFRGHGTASWERSMHDSWCVSANRLCGCPDQPVEVFENPSGLGAIGCPEAVLGCGTWVVPRPRYLSHAALELETDPARPPILGPRRRYLWPDDFFDISHSAGRRFGFRVPKRWATYISRKISLYVSSPRLFLIFFLPLHLIFGRSSAVISESNVDRSGGPENHTWTLPRRRCYSTDWGV